MFLCNVRLFSFADPNPCHRPATDKVTNLTTTGNNKCLLYFFSSLTLTGHECTSVFVQRMFIIYSNDRICFLFYKQLDLNNRQHVPSLL